MGSESCQLNGPSSVILNRVSRTSVRSLPRKFSAGLEIIFLCSVALSQLYVYFRVTKERHSRNLPGLGTGLCVGQLAMEGAAGT